jgi:hypothetical protein
MKDNNIFNRARGGTTFSRLLVLTAILLGWANLQALAFPNQYKVYRESAREPLGSITTWSATNSGDTIIFNLHNSVSGSNWMVRLELAKGEKSATTTIDEREPEGSHNIFFSAHDNPNISFFLHNSVSGSNWIKSWPRGGITLPYALRDVDSSVVYEVEADGRHVSATDRFGALLWYRDPFEDAHLKHYRTDTPRIVTFDFHKRGESENWDLPERILQKKGIKNYISIMFNSSQSGFLDVTTGDFFFTGQR